MALNKIATIKFNENVKIATKIVKIKKEPATIGNSG